MTMRADVIRLLKLRLLSHSVNPEFDFIRSFFSFAKGFSLFALLELSGLGHDKSVGRRITLTCASSESIARDSDSWFNTNCIGNLPELYTSAENENFVYLTIFVN